MAEDQPLLAGGRDAEPALRDLAVGAADADLDGPDEQLRRRPAAGRASRRRRSSRPTPGRSDERLHQPGRAAAPRRRRRSRRRRGSGRARRRSGASAGGAQPSSRRASSASGTSTCEHARVGVDRDHVAVADGGERTAAGRLGRHVADHQPARRAREAAVGDERDRLAEPDADHRGGDAQHLAHARPAGRALVADDEHVARRDRARAHRGDAGRLVVEHARRPGLARALGAGELDEAALGREVAAQRAQRAARLVRRGAGEQDVAVGRGRVGRRRRRASRPRPSARRRRVAARDQLADQRGVPPARCSVSATWRPPGDRLASTGVRAASAVSSSCVSSTPASRAIASRCSTPLVEPPWRRCRPSRCAARGGRGTRARSARRRARPPARPARAAAARLRLAVLGGDQPVARLGEPEAVDRHRHRVRGELPGARARARGRPRARSRPARRARSARAGARRPPPRRRGSSARARRSRPARCGPL